MNGVQFILCMGLTIYSLGVCGQTLGSGGSDASFVVIARQIPACSLQPPYEQKGYFSSGTRLEVLGPAGEGRMHVRFRTADGRLIEASCRAEDLTAPAPVTASARAGSLEYNDRAWLEDTAGHAQAVELQSRLEQPLLIFFHADWNDGCQFLWKELLDTQDFKNRARNVIKLKINPEHGKDEGLLANKYRLRKYPTTMVIDQPNAKPRYLDLFYWSFGRMKTPSVDYAMDSILCIETNRKPWEAKAPAATDEP